MRQTSLHSGWVFIDASEKPAFARSAVQYQPWLPATVPGHVHLDLYDNGIIDDPFYRMNELGSRWVDDSDWTYKTTFEWTSDSALPHRVLKFEGLDTVCTVWLNEKQIGSFDNMFVPVEIDVTESLIEGSNELEVRFVSAVRTGDERRAVYFEAEGLPEDRMHFDERAFVRKAQYMSAWDWGPRLVSCGIWRPVSLIEYAARITSFTIFQTPLEDGSYRVSSETVVEGAGEVTLSFGDFSVVSEASDLHEIEFIVAEPRLWWPNGMGEQHLYPASASIAEGNEIAKKIGLRTIFLERAKDEMGETFTFFVNGKKLWARGANWIPNDSFPSQVTRDDYWSQVKSCKSLGMNMLRVWGGGLYELDDFYDACDEAGLLVWQDFTYACSYYADGPEACKIARWEAEYHVRRLRDRASLALWCANNENLTMWQGKWGGEKSPPRYYGENIYNKVLPNLIAELDSFRSYIPSSPIGQATPEGDCNQGKFGDSHYWDVWHGRGDWIYYKDSDTRFSSEFGFASSCSIVQWGDVLDEETDWEKDSAAVRWHDKTGKGWEKFYGYVEAHYPSPQSLEDWTYYSQLNQRDALRFGIEHWRRADYCQGTLIWQFNDCWPVQSWAVQDYLRLLKPAGYELKRLYGDRLVSLDRDGSSLSVYLVNDTASVWTSELKLDIYSATDGSILNAFSLSGEAGPGGRTLLKTIEVGDYGNGIARVSDSTGIWATALLSEPKEMEFGPVRYNAKIKGKELVISAKGVAVDLSVIDVEDVENLRPAGIDLPGVAAVTLINDSVTYTFLEKPKQIMLRSLSGTLNLKV